MTNNNKNEKEILDLNSYFQEYILGLLKQTMETMIIKMYASGVSTREIANIIEKLYGNS